MLIRPRPFLTFLALCLVPLVLLALVNYWNAVRTAAAALEREQESKLRNFKHDVDQLLTRDQNALAMLSRSEPLREYLRSRSESAVNSSTSPRAQAGSDLGPQRAAANSIPAELSVRVASVLNPQSHFASISLLDQNGRALFLANLRSTATGDPPAFQTEHFSSEQARLADRLWTTHANGLRSAVSSGPAGARVVYTVPILQDDQALGSPQGTLVGDLPLDAILSEAAERDTSFLDVNSSERISPLFVVVDRSGRFLYHSNATLRHQLASDSMPAFIGVLGQMLGNDYGRTSFTSTDGARYAVAYDRLPVLSVSVAAASSRDQALAAAHRVGRIGLLLSVLLGLVVAWLLTRYFHRQAYGIERVAAGVEAIAKGTLDHHIDLRSSDDLRPLADNVGLVTKQLREQIARETETRQFQSFVRLSAVLTHDLKNAIEALSLIVSNMERHFDNEEFRADAMRSLNLATQDLRALVTRLSTPVNTLSGEHKRPQPADLIPMLQRVISLTAEPARERHKIRIDLPESLLALVDLQRIQRVIENLIINGLEAMTHESGTLTVAAGQTNSGKVFFSVSDTGVGMSARFIEEKLFHPFATTKERGVGLGLYTCREVVRANGGAIEVESIQGAGTTFRVVLPSAAFDTRGDREQPSQSHD